MCAAANYAVCCSDKDLAQSLCFFPQRTHLFTFTFMHLADAFIQSDLQCIQAIHVLSLCVFPGNQTHNLCTANAMLYH